MPHFLGLHGDISGYEIYTNLHCDCTEEISSSHIVWELWGKDSHRSNALKNGHTHIDFCIVCIAFFNTSCGTITLPDQPSTEI